VQPVPVLRQQGSSQPHSILAEKRYARAESKLHPRRLAREGKYVCVAPSKVVGGGVVVCNFLSAGSTLSSRTCAEKLHANCPTIDVACNWLRFDQWSQDRNNCSKNRFRDWNPWTPAM
jgi:hypothetical protein